MKRSHNDAALDEEENIDVEAGNDSDDDDFDRVPGYDASKESLPQSTVFTQAYRDIAKSIQEMTSLLTEPLTGATEHSAVLEGLLHEIHRRTKGEYPEEVRVALVGSMKSGKSSVINSLLSTGIIARQGDPGRSCTWVVNEFRYLLTAQTQPYAADVYFFTQDERQELIRSMVVNHYRASSKYAEECEEPLDKDSSNDDFNTQKDVVTACMALFKDREEFQTQKRAQAFLASADSDNIEEIIDQLVTWVEERMAVVLQGLPAVRLEAGTSSGLLQMLGPYQYTVNSHYGEVACSMWPLVNHIKFGLDCALLQNNLCLVDLPGLTDANKIRVQNANEHLRACTHEMIVADIARAEDDNFIRDRFRESFMLRTSGRTILVLTHGDDMDENTDFSGSGKDEAMFMKLANETEQLERKMSEITSRIQKGGPDKQRWKAARRATAKELQKKTVAEQKFKLAARTKDTSAKMGELYLDITQDPVALPIFVVGNKAYGRHHAGYDRDRPAPILSVEETQIPALRRHLFVAPAEGKMTEARHLVFTQLHVAIKSANLFVSNSHLDRKDEIQRIITSPQARIDTIVDNAIDRWKERAEELVLKPYRGCDQAWSKEARRLCVGWATANSSQMHLNWLKKHGLKKAKGRGARMLSWNNALIEIKGEEIDGWFGNLLALVSEAEKPIFRAFSGLVNRMIAEIKADEQYNLMALKSFAEYVWAEKGNMRPCVAKPMKTLRKALSHAYGMATSEEPDNQIVRAMVPIYDKAEQIKGAKHGGKQAPQNRVNYFTREVCKQGDGVWMRSHDLLQRDLNKLFDKHGADLKSSMLGFLEGIEAKFAAMSDERSTETPEEAVVRDALGKNVIKVSKKHDEELYPAAVAFFGPQQAMFADE